MTDDFALYEQVMSHLDRWQKRRLRSDATLWLPRGILAGLVAAAAVAALARFRPVLHNREVALIALVMALLGLILSLLAIYLRRATLLEQARYFDGQFGLQERVSTAIEIRSGRLSATPMLAEYQLADAAAAMSRVDDRAGLPVRPRWQDIMLICLTVALIILAVILPNDQSSVLVEQQALAQVIAEEINGLQALERRLANDPRLDDSGRGALLEPIQGALDELNAGRLSREEAVAALSEAEAELRELSEVGDGRATGGQSLAQALQAASQSLAQDSGSSPLAQALAGADLAEAGAAADRLANDLAQLSAAERDGLARNLQESARRLAEVDPELTAELTEAARALQRNELDQAQQALQAAASTLQQRAFDQSLAEQALAAADELQAARAEVAAAGNQAGSEAMARDDQGEQAYPGQGQADQGSSAGPGVGSSSGMDGSPDAGPGAMLGAGNAAEEGQGAGGPGPGGGQATTVFVPDYVDLGSQEGVEIQLPVECVANPERCGLLIEESPAEFSDVQSLVPYEQVFGDYRNAAFEALEGDYVPFGMKGLVRDYFSSLEP